MRYRHNRTEVGCCNVNSPITQRSRKINWLASSDEYIIRVDDNEVNSAVSLASRISSIRRLDVHDPEGVVNTNKAILKLSFSFY